MKLGVNRFGSSESGHQGCFHHWQPGFNASAKSCPTLCNTMNHNLPGSSVHGILQARILEWVAISSSRGSSQPRVRTPHLRRLLHWQATSLPREPPGNTQRGYKSPSTWI